MPLTKANQDLARDFLGLASDLKWSAAELMRIAVRLSEAGNEHNAQAVIRICQVMQAVDWMDARSNASRPPYFLCKSVI